MKILCVDDEETVVNTVSMYLRGLWSRAEMLRPFDGATALEMFEEEQPDLVILDLFLPDISGYELIRRIREQSTAPVLVLTELAEGKDIAKALDLGADACVTKPFHISVFLAKVKAVLRRCAMGSGVLGVWSVRATNSRLV
ncbi:MAG: response regulator transcription factor [Chloroflexota bacterium]|nr:response regulator transcription factor [Chloroflexota bacterium]